MSTRLSEPAADAAAAGCAWPRLRQAMAGEASTWAYIGKVLVALYLSGWIAMRLDLGNVDWDHIGEWLRKSWIAVAPARLRQAFSIADEF